MWAASASSEAVKSTFPSRSTRRPAASRIASTVCWLRLCRGEFLSSCTTRDRSGLRGHGRTTRCKDPSCDLQCDLGLARRSLVWGTAKRERLSGMSGVGRSVLLPLPYRDFDVTEMAVSWKLLTEAGYSVVFTTEHGDVPAAARCCSTVCSSVASAPSRNRRRTTTRCSSRLSSGHRGAGQMSTPPRSPDSSCRSAMPRACASISKDRTCNRRSQNSGLCSVRWERSVTACSFSLALEITKVAPCSMISSGSFPRPKSAPSRRLFRVQNMGPFRLTAFLLTMLSR